MQAEKRNRRALPFITLACRLIHPTPENQHTTSNEKLARLRTLQHIIHIHILRDLKIIRQRTVLNSTQIITL